MEVTKDNFASVLQELDDVLKNADFISIDGEFTGLNSGPSATVYDTPAQYYQKLRTGSMDFLLVQFGLSIFTYNETNKRYSQRCYNFYVFPRPMSRWAIDSKFTCQSSCMAFLADQGFDFNKLFKSGIPYLTPGEEEALLKRLEERQKSREEVSNVIPIPETDREQIEDICTRIKEFLDSESEELVLDRLNGFIRRLVYQESKKRWPHKLRIETMGDGVLRNMSVHKLKTLDEEERKIAEQNEKEREELRQAVGLGALLKKISESKKLIVGHNMLLDICHIVHQFFAPLPESYAEFKELVHELFPRVLDTKVICHSAQLKENVPCSNLNILLETVSKAPFSLPEIDSVDGQSYSLSASNYHEAGYDAFITGVCFIALNHYLGTLPTGSPTPAETAVLANSPLLSRFVNKLIIMRLKDIPYINLTGNDPEPSRDHVFHVTFPKDWKLKDVIQAFHQFGGVFVSWLTDSSAYVSLNRRDNVVEVIKNLKNIKNCTIKKYHEFQKILDKECNKTSDNHHTTTDDGQKTSAQQKTADKNKDNDGWELVTGKKRRRGNDKNADQPAAKKQHAAFSEPTAWE